jgi:hypothetical protein
MQGKRTQAENVLPLHPFVIGKKVFLSGNGNIS